MSTDFYTYLFTRQDLSIPQQIIQTAHAIHEMGVNQGNQRIPNAVLIGMMNEDELIAMSNYLKAKDIDYVMFYEPDINQYTAIATFPLQSTSDKRQALIHLETMQ